MAKKCFLSFHYAADSWRVQQIKNIGAIEEQPLLSANRWEEVKRKGDTAVKEWIENNLRGKECLIVLIGSHTSKRRWVKYEIERACAKGIGVLGVYIHNLKDDNQQQSTKGASPFDGVTYSGRPITSFAKTYDPPYTVSNNVYNHIATNIESWADAAIKLRK